VLTFCPTPTLVGRRFITSLASAEVTNLSDDEAFAIGINAYNAFAINTLVNHACKYDSKGVCQGAVCVNLVSANTVATATQVALATTAACTVCFTPASTHTWNHMIGPIRPKMSSQTFHGHPQRNVISYKSTTDICFLTVQLGWATRKLGTDFLTLRWGPPVDSISRSTCLPGKTTASTTWKACLGTSIRQHVSTRTVNCQHGSTSAPAL
jgi:hypothetical protein